MPVESIAQSAVSKSDVDAAGPTQSIDATIQDYMTQQPGGLSGISRTPEAEARLLSNPANLGERILGSLEGLHQRNQEISKAQNEPPAETNPVAFAPEPGPAARLPSASSGAGSGAVAVGDPQGTSSTDAMEPFNEMLGTIREMNDHYLEVRLVGNVASSSTSSVNTLLRGQ